MTVLLSTLAISLGPLLGVVVGSFLNKWTTVSVARELAGVEKQKDIATRIWELRRIGYSMLLEELMEVSKYANWIDSGYNQHAEAFDQSDRRRTYEERVDEKWTE